MFNLINSDELDELHQKRGKEEHNHLLGSEKGSDLQPYIRYAEL